MGRGVHCTPKKRELIKKLISDGKTYKFIREIVGCSNKIITNAKNTSKKKKQEVENRN